EAWLDGRGRALMPEEHFNVGGKTKWYGAALLRFAPHEFEADPAHTCVAWPIRYADLEPYYTEAERLLGVRQLECEPDLERILDRVTRRCEGWESQPIPLALSPEITMQSEEARHFDGFASPRGLK